MPGRFRGDAVEATEGGDGIAHAVVNAATMLSPLEMHHGQSLIGGCLGGGQDFVAICHTDNPCRVQPGQVSSQIDEQGTSFFSTCK